MKTRSKMLLAAAVVLALVQMACGTAVDMDDINDAYRDQAAATSEAFRDQVLENYHYSSNGGGGDW